MTNTPVADLVRNALDFANQIAGEGMEIYGISPEYFLMEYSVATGDEDWDTLPDRIAAALTPASAEPVAVPDGNPDLNLAAWMDVRRSQLGPWADYLIREVGKLEGEIARMRDHHPAPVTVEAAARETALKIMQMEVETFCRRVEAGEIRSKRTYAAFTDCIRALSGEKS